MKWLHELMDTFRQNAKRHSILLICIVVLGIFLRTYQFHDWMLFNPDQARDALLVQHMLEGKEWPLLGPQVGNTVFKLGPIFYYFEFTSAWLFGPSANKMAYPDLLFSILAIILVYFFFKRFFNRNIALTLTFLFSISFFVVTYSRFAFNPNSIPFFTLLFLLSLFNIINNAPKERFLWAALLGTAMGVGFQLHTLLFIAMPLSALLVLGYLFIKKQFIWKSALVTLFFFFLFNAGQLLSEMRNNGANVRAFFIDARANTESASRNYVFDFSNDILCHIQGNTYIISSLGGGDKCDLTKLSRRIEKKGIVANFRQTAFATFGTLFTLGGLILLFWYTKKETDMKRRQALLLIAVYCGILFLILLPVSSGMSIRYFITIEFLPFLLAGFWIRFFLEKIPGKLSLFCAGLFIITLTTFNILAIKEAVMTFRNKTASTDNVAYFGEVELMGKYILERSKGAETIYLAGKKSYLSRYGKPLQYFAEQEGILLSKSYNKERITASDPFFYITKKASKRSSSAEVIKGFVTEEAATFGNVTIVKLIRKP